MQSFLSNTASDHLNYLDDYNSTFLNTFRDTECFQNWDEQNRKKIENNLFKMNEFDQNPRETNASSALSQTNINQEQTG